MLWFTLRLHRTEILLFTAVIAVLLAFLIPLGILEHQAFVTSGLQRCVQSAQPWPASCYELRNQFQGGIYGQIQGYFSWLVLLPLLFGIFLGVPVVAHQYERGSYRFLFTQGMSRARWLLLSCLPLGIIVLALTGALVAVTTWWNGPFEVFTTPYEQKFWDSEHIMPFVLGIFGLAIGITSGAVTRRILPGVGLAAVYVPIWIVFDQVARGFLLPWNRAVFNLPVSSATDTTDWPNGYIGDWIVQQGELDRSGNKIAEGVIDAACYTSGSTSDPQQAQQASDSCLQSHGFKGYILWQPISHYWGIQLVEAGIFAVLTALLIWGAIVLVRQRRG